MPLSSDNQENHGGADEIKEEISKKLERIKDDARENSAILSERIRIVSLAIIGLCWTFIIANLTSNAQSGAGLISTTRLLAPILAAILALLFDFLQYMFTQISINIRLHEMPRAYSVEEQTSLYNYLRSGSKPRLSARLDRAAYLAYALKTVSTILAAVLFGYIILAII